MPRFMSMAGHTFLHWPFFTAQRFLSQAGCSAHPILATVQEVPMEEPPTTAAPTTVAGGADTGMGAWHTSAKPWQQGKLAPGAMQEMSHAHAATVGLLAMAIALPQLLTRQVGKILLVAAKLMVVAAGMVAGAVAGRTDLVAAGSTEPAAGAKLATALIGGEEKAAGGAGEGSR